MQAWGLLSIDKDGNGDRTVHCTLISTWVSSDSDHGTEYKASCWLVGSTSSASSFISVLRCPFMRWTWDSGFRTLSIAAPCMVCRLREARGSQDCSQI